MRRRDMIDAFNEYAKRHKTPPAEYDESVIYWSVKELAAAVDVKIKHIQYLVAKGDIPSIRAVSGGRAKYLIHPDDAEKFIKERS